MFQATSGDDVHQSLSRKRSHAIRDYCEFVEISPGNLTLRIPLPVNVFEQVKVRMENEVQAFKQEVRGTVRSSVTEEDVFTRLEIELLTRLCSFDLTALENAGVRDKPVKGPVWI